MYCFSPRVASARVSLKLCFVLCAMCYVVVRNLPALSEPAGGSEGRALRRRPRFAVPTATDIGPKSAMMNDSRFLSRACREMPILNALPEGAWFLGSSRIGCSQNEGGEETRALLATVRNIVTSLSLSPSYIYQESLGRTRTRTNTIPNGTEANPAG